MSSLHSVRPIHVGMFGLGTVGTGVARLLMERRQEIVARTGIPLQLNGVCVRRTRVKRHAPQSVLNRLTTNPNALLNDPSIDIIVELIGGIHPAKELILKAFERGKHVVTANKALLAEEGRALFRAAQRHNRMLFFEASVGGGIPIIKALREGLAANRIESLYGIINGTANYILSSMDRTGCDMASALAEAQQLGYAESNPGLDIDGIDSVHKLIILTQLAFGARVPIARVHVEGIRHLQASDVLFAKQLGYCVKLLAIAKRQGDDLEVRVHPTLIPVSHPFASVHGAYNAVLVKGDLADDQLFYGRGAGQKPTASAVMADIIELGQLLTGGYTMPQWTADHGALRLKPMPDVSSRFYLRSIIVDRPGMLAQLARILGRHDISIDTVIQQGHARARHVPLVLLTHQATERNVRRALRQIDALSMTKHRSVMIRIEELSDR